VTGPLNPVGSAGFTPVQYAELHAVLGSAPAAGDRSARASRPRRQGHGCAVERAYQLYRATQQFVSTDGKTIQFETSLAAGDPVHHGGAQRGARGARRGGVGGASPARHRLRRRRRGCSRRSTDISAISNSDLAHVIPIAIIVIGVLLALVMRSLIAPLY